MKRCAGVGKVGHTPPHNRFKSLSMTMFHPLGLVMRLVLFLVMGMGMFMLCVPIV